MTEYPERSLLTKQDWAEFCNGDGSESRICERWTASNELATAWDDFIVAMGDALGIRRFLYWLAPIEERLTQKTRRIFRR